MRSVGQAEVTSEAMTTTGATAVAEYLQGLGVAYELIEHEPTMSAAAEARATHRPQEQVAKTLILQDGRAYVMAVIPASERLDLHKLRHVLGATQSLRLASEQEIERDFPLLEIGAAPPLGPMMPVAEVIDRRLLASAHIVCAGGDHRHALVLDSCDLVRLTGAEIADICAEDDPEAPTTDIPSPPVYIVGWDASASAGAALELALHLRGITGARVIAVNVYGAIPVSFAPYGSASLYGRCEGILRADAERVLEALDGAMVERRAVCAPSVAQGLHELAAAEGAQLIAMGRAQRHGVGTVVPGSSAERVLHGAPCAVAVAPETPEPERRINRIAVAYDGREPSQRALDAATALAAGLRAQLLLIGVVEPLSLSATLPGDDRRDVNDAMRADMQQLLEQAAAALPSALRPHTRLDTGPAGASLIDACTDEDVDLLVLGSRAYGVIAGALAGSVSHEVVNRSPCPLIIVPRGAATASGFTPAAAAARG